MTLEMVISSIVVFSCLLFLQKSIGVFDVVNKSDGLTLRSTIIPVVAITLIMLPSLPNAIAIGARLWDAVALQFAVSAALLVTANLAAALGAFIKCFRLLYGWQHQYSRNTALEVKFRLRRNIVVLIFIAIIWTYVCTTVLPFGFSILAVAVGGLIGTSVSVESCRLFFNYVADEIA